ncbi:4'-phosphopantetheinyl transferase [Corynebacterium sp. NML130628]|nr:4'-phosphopantetheinyl transferase [Corynebacterium sp. NML130628]
MGGEQLVRDLSLFPSSARFVSLRTDDSHNLRNYDNLDEQEKGVVSGAVDVRKGEFGDARWCAHRALDELGVQGPHRIMRGEAGMPLWPEGVCGSLTHTDGFRAAVVAPLSQVRSIGIDAELAEPLPEGVLSQIACPTELQMLDALRAEGWFWADRLLFCAKEATYKCWFPLARKMLEFDQAEIYIRPDGTFVSYILERPTPAPFFEGRWVHRAGYVITSAFLL